MMLIYTLVFGVVFGASEPYFPVFIFMGLTMYTFFNRSVTMSVDLIRQRKEILTKIYVPKYILILVVLFWNGFKALLSLGIGIIMALFYQVHFSINVLWAIPTLLTLFLLTFGVSCFFMHMGVFVNDLTYITTILLQMLMYFSGIFYSVENCIPQPWGNILEKGNPVAFLIATFLNAVLYKTKPDLLVLGCWGIVSILLSVLGILLIYANENAYIKVV